MSKKILLIEDEPAISAIYEMILGGGGYQVKCADNGASAIPIIESWNPDLILLDLMMPVMDGAQTIKHISDNDIAVPVVILTNIGESEVPEDIKNSKQIKDILVKVELEPAGLLDKVASVFK